MRQITDDAMLQEFHERGAGYIYNDFAGMEGDGARYNVLHAASCYWNAKSNTNIPKYFFENLEEAEQWLEEYRGAEGENWKRCGSCGAKSRAEDERKGSEMQAAGGGEQGQVPRKEQQATRFLVRRADRGGEPTVQVWSVRRLPFEPKGWLLALRGSIRKALVQLEAEPGRLLHGIYGSQDDGNFDVENVLFYNVGPSFVAKAGRYGVRFERTYAAPEPPEPLEGASLHYDSYSLEEMNWQFRHWRSGALIARWEFEGGEGVLNDCARVWTALKKSTRVWVHEENVVQPLAVRIVIGLPGAVSMPVTAVLKPLIDGVISAFHYHEGGDETELAERLKGRTGVEASRIENWLTDRRQAALGGRRLLWPRGKSVQWNPADERCVAVEVQARSLAKAERFVVRGEMREAVSLA